MKRVFVKVSCFLFVVILLMGALVFAPQRQVSAQPQAQTSYRTLNYLYSISGNHTLAGQHNKEPNSNPAQYTNQANSVTGRYPAMWSGDLLFAQSDINARQTMFNEALNQWNRGAVIQIMAHVCPPTQGAACAWDGGVVSHLSDTDWNNLVTNGTALNNAWKARMDTWVPYFQFLKDNGAEVLFRPQHEMNQGVFWWAGRTGANGTAKLFQITHDYLRNTKGLTNIIWVWDLQDFGSLASDLNNYDPGSSYWDVLALDVYRSDGQGYTTAKYNAMVSKAGSKPIAIGEADILPTSSQLSSQPRWTFFMGWAELTFSANTSAQIQAVYGASNVITREEMPGWGSPAPTPTRTATVVGTNLALNRPATASSSESATYPASNAVDGNSSTRWSSAYSDPQWIYVDLGASYNVNRVRLNWEAAYANAYQVQVSNDASSWTTIYSRTSGAGGLNDLTVSGTGRYVRMYGTTRATAYGYSLFDFEVYGTAVGGPTPTRTPTPSGSGISTTTWYSLAAKHSGKCVDARASGTANGTVIQHYTCNNGFAQQFQFQLVSGNIYRLGNRNSSSQVLDIAGQSTADGGLAQLWASNGQTNQQWTAVSEGNGYYHFVNVGSGKCLDVPSASTADSIQLQQWACNGNAQQSFLLQVH